MSSSAIAGFQRQTNIALPTHDYKLGSNTLFDHTTPIQEYQQPSDVFGIPHGNFTLNASTFRFNTDAYVKFSHTDFQEPIHVPHGALIGVKYIGAAPNTENARFRLNSPALPQYEGFVVGYEPASDYKDDETTFHIINTDFTMKRAEQWERVAIYWNGPFSAIPTIRDQKPEIPEEKARINSKVYINVADDGSGNYVKAAYSLDFQEKSTTTWKSRLIGSIQQPIQPFNMNGLQLMHLYVQQLTALK